jgi:hypothetical protein
MRTEATAEERLAELVTMALVDDDPGAGLVFRTLLDVDPDPRATLVVAVGQLAGDLCMDARRLGRNPVAHWQHTRASELAAAGERGER